MLIYFDVTWNSSPDRLNYSKRRMQSHVRCKGFKICTYTNILGLSINMTYTFLKDGFHLTISAFSRSSISIAFNSQKFVCVFLIRIVRMCSINILGKTVERLGENNLLDDWWRAIVSKLWIASFKIKFQNRILSFYIT